MQGDSIWIVISTSCQRTPSSLGGICSRMSTESFERWSLGYKTKLQTNNTQASLATSTYVLRRIKKGAAVWQPPAHTCHVMRRIIFFPSLLLKNRSKEKRISFGCNKVIFVLKQDSKYLALKIFLGFKKVNPESYQNESSSMIQKTMSTKITIKAIYIYLSR